MKPILSRLFSAIPTLSPPYSVLYFGSEEYARATLNTVLELPNLSSLIKRLVAVVPPHMGANSPTETMHLLIKQKQLEHIVYRKRLKSVEEYIVAEKAKNECPFDIGVIGSFGRKIPPAIIGQFPLGMLVAHPSLLPKYRGPCPIQHAAINGEKTTGATIIDISKEVIDGGSILWQGECEIDEENDNYQTLAQKCGALAGEGIGKVLEDLEQYRKRGKKQDETQATQAPMIGKENAVFRWDKQSPEEVARLQRGLYKSPSPATGRILLNGKWKTVFFEKLVKIDENTPDPVGKKEGTPGELYWNPSKTTKKKLCIRCQNGWVYTETIKVEGSGFMKVEQFVKNYLKGRVDGQRLAIEGDEQKVAAAGGK